MNKTNKVFVVTSMVVLSLLISSCSSQEKEVMEKEVMEKEVMEKEVMEKEVMEKEVMEKEVMEKEVAMIKSAWLYSDYSEEKLSSAKWNIVLFFAASWCPSCKTADKNLKDNTIPEGLTVLKLDYDSNKDLKKKYEVTSQHTFVEVDNKWNMIKKWSGSRDSEWILKKLNKKSR
jgi:pentapeptide MXKDX repeat protein